MKKIAVWLMGTLSAVVWLFSYRTSTVGSLPSPAKPGTVTGPNISNGPVMNVAGAAADTRWGPVQVELMIQSHKVVGVSLLQQPDGNAMDTFLGNRAFPVLINETIQAQSAKIAAVTGASFTSAGYLQSLQSALDKAAL